MPEREDLIVAFLGNHGWGTARRVAMAGDASFRRYERLIRDERTVLLMDAPPPEENVSAFSLVDRHLRNMGLGAPEIFAEDAEAGLMLIEDFGDDTYTRLLAEGGDEKALYRTAVDVLVHLHRSQEKCAIPDAIDPYDNEKLLDEAFLLTDWYMPALFGKPTPEPVRQSYGEAWLGAFPIIHEQPRTLVLRDYHLNNLMLSRSHDGIKACGLLDFQDALRGPAAYDLVSLLEDSRRDVNPVMARDMLEYYLDAFPEIKRNEFTDVFTILGCQRHAKVIGIFTRLYLRDGKPEYIAHIPRLWRLIEQSLEHPSLARLKSWMDRHIPIEARKIPQCPAPTK